MGVTLYELLAGQVPFQGNSQYDIEHAHISMIPQPPTVHYPHIPGPVVDAVMRSLEKDPAARFQTAEEFSTALLESSWSGTGFHSEITPGPVRPPFTGQAGQTGPVADPTQATQPFQVETAPAWPTAETLSNPQLDLGNAAADGAGTVPWPDQTAAHIAGTAVQPRPPERRPKSVVAGMAAAAVLLLAGGSYWAYTLLKPHPEVIVHHDGGTAPGPKHGTLASNGGDGKQFAPPDPGPGLGTGHQTGTGKGLEPPPGSDIGLALGKTPRPHVENHPPIPPSRVPVSDALSGNWTGTYKNLCSSTGNTSVTMILATQTGGAVTGNLNFSGQAGIGGICSVQGRFHAQDGSLTISPSVCSGTVPSYFTRNHSSALMLSGTKMSGSVSPEDNSTCMQVSLSRAN
jgi:hypothetical protein